MGPRLFQSGQMHAGRAMIKLNVWNIYSFCIILQMSIFLPCFDRMFQYPKSILSKEVSNFRDWEFTVSIALKINRQLITWVLPMQIKFGAIGKLIQSPCPRDFARSSYEIILIRYRNSAMTSWHGNLWALLYKALYNGNPLLTDGFLSQRTNNEDLSCFHCS